MGFKELLTPDTGNLLFVSSGYKGWEDFRRQSALRDERGDEVAGKSVWYYTDKMLADTFKAPSIDGEYVADLLSSSYIKDSSYRSFKEAMVRFLTKYHKEGVDYSPRLRMMPKPDNASPAQYHTAVAERFVSAMDINGFVPVAFKYTSSDNPSFYFVGFYEDDPSGTVNFLSRISNHIRPKHNQTKGEIDFFLGAFYDFDNDPRMANPRANSLTIDLDAFDTFLAVKKASFRKRAYGESVAPQLRSTFERAYRKEVTRLKAELNLLESVYLAAFNALAVGITYITRYTMPSLEVPPASDTNDFSVCHVRRYPLLKGTGTGEETRQAFLSLIQAPAPEPSPENNEDRQDELFDSPPAISVASVSDPAGLLLSVIRMFNNVMDRLAFCEDLLVAHKDYLSGLLAQLEGFVDEKASLMNATLGAIEALSGIIPDTIIIFDRQAVLLTAMRQSLDLLKDPGNKNKVRSQGYPAWDSWWDASVVKARYKGVPLLQPPSRIADYFKDF